MAQREIQVDQVVDAMNVDSTLTAIFDGRIYFGKPISDKQIGTYLVFNIVTTPIVEQSYLMVRLEARFNSHDTNTKTKDLIDVKNAVSNYLEQTSIHGTFTTFKIIEGGNFYNGLDEKGRKVLVQDYLFYFAIFN